MHFFCMNSRPFAVEYFRSHYPRKYYSYRNPIAVALSVFSQGGPGGWQIYYAILSKTPSTYTGAANAAIAVYILGSFFFFNRPWQLSLVPHMASSVLVLPFVLYRNPATCDTPIMNTDAGKYVTQHLFTILDTAHACLAPTSSTPNTDGGESNFQNRLSPRAMCVVTSNTLVVATGFILPTMLLAAREAAEYHKFRMQHNWRGRAPMSSQLYQTLGSKDAMDRMRLGLIMTLLVHITWTCHLKMVSGQ
jgi:hypothetical protein